LYGVTATPTVEQLCDNIQFHIDSGTQVRIVAHNAKFDLKYLMRDRPDVHWHEVEVMCTMTAEYINTGQATKTIGLEALCAEKGVPFAKSLDLGALLASGVTMEDIPTSDLQSYLVDDVAAVRGLHKAMGWVDTSYILPLAEMELNGLPVDIPAAQQLLAKLTMNTDLSEGMLEDHIKTACEWQDGSPVTDDDFTNAVSPKGKYIRVTANRTISFLLSGVPGPELSITTKWKLRYKNGYGPRFTQMAHGWDPQTVTHIGYPVGESVLKALPKNWISDTVLAYRRDAKVIGTYLGPMLEVAAIQGAVYPKLNTAVTGTGRLSSSAPNGQNMPTEVRELIKSTQGLMIEIDFKQLEVVVMACISGDPQLLDDLHNGEDIHYNVGKSVFGWKTTADMNDKDRKTVKGVVFGLMYGGKAPGLAKSTGVSKKKVIEIIDSFYNRFPAVKKWKEDTFTQVVNNMVPKDIYQGEQRYQSLYTCPFSQRKYMFTEQKAPDWIRQKTGRALCFSPMQIANYPIQGLAGGGIVMRTLYNLWVNIRSDPMRYSNQVKFRMTVHDSIVLDVPHVPGIDIDNAVGSTMVRYSLPVQLNYDIQQGDHWS
jgi:DNA polymerase I-like protein with 3'-5' exonuclease and polymerase domains